MDVKDPQNQPLSTPSEGEMDFNAEILASLSSIQEKVSRMVKGGTKYVGDTNGNVELTAPEVAPYQNRVGLSMDDYVELSGATLSDGFHASEAGVQHATTRIVGDFLSVVKRLDNLKKVLYYGRDASELLSAADRAPLGTPTASRNKIIKLSHPNPLLMDAFRLQMRGVLHNNAIKEMVGGLSKRVFLNLRPYGQRRDGGCITPATLSVAPEVKTGVVEFLGFSRLDNNPMFVVFHGAYLEESSLTEAEPLQLAFSKPWDETFKEAVTAFDTTGKTNVVPVVLDAATLLINFPEPEDLQVSLITSLEDQIPGFVAAYQPPVPETPVLSVGNYSLTQDQQYLLHGAIGIATESGELLEQVFNGTVNGKELDAVNVREEIFDIMWYIAIFIRVLGINFYAGLKNNIDKLWVRYKGKFTQFGATVRNLSRERQILEK